MLPAAAGGPWAYRDRKIDNPRHLAKPPLPSVLET
jgi:hypothetical protein